MHEYLPAEIICYEKWTAFLEAQGIDILQTHTKIHFSVDQELLRTVPTFVSAHTFYASRRAWFKRHVRAGLTMTQSITLPSTRLKWKQNFPTVTKSSLMYLYLNQEQQNISISRTTNC